MALRVTTIATAIYIANAVPTLALDAGELETFCNTEAPTEQQTYCLGYLMGIHESIVVQQKLNGVSGNFCMRVEARDGETLRKALSDFLKVMPDQRAQSARMAVTTAYVLTFPCGQ